MSTTTTKPALYAPRGRLFRSGFYEVRATDAEVAEHVKRLGRPPAVPRAECAECGRRIWHSGLGVGSHRRHCNRGVPQAAADYFRLPDWATQTTGMRHAPIISDAYVPGIGWQPLDARPVTVARLQGLREQGVTVVNLGYNGRYPDFQVKELLG